MIQPKGKHFCAAKVQPSVPRCSEALFIGCPHPEYRDVRLPDHQLVFDCWGLRRPSLSITKGASGAKIPPQLRIGRCLKQARHMFLILMPAGSFQARVPPAGVCVWRWWAAADTWGCRCRWCSRTAGTLWWWWTRRGGWGGLGWVGWVRWVG